MSSATPSTSSPSPPRVRRLPLAGRAAPRRARRHLVQARAERGRRGRPAQSDAAGPRPARPGDVHDGRVAVRALRPQPARTPPGPGPSPGSSLGMVGGLARRPGRRLAHRRRRRARHRRRAAGRRAEGAVRRRPRIGPPGHADPHLHHLRLPLRPADPRPGPRPPGAGRRRRRAGPGSSAWPPALVRPHGPERPRPPRAP